jgi:hypothetical protein
VVNRRLGGAAALLRAGVPALYHLGYTVTVGKRRYSSAGWRGAKNHGAPGDTGRSTAPFSAVSGGIPLRWLTIPFQLVVHALVSGPVAEWFQSLVKGRMIHPARTIPLALERHVVVDADSVRLEDILRPARPLEVDGVAVTTQPTMHSPSARLEGSTSVDLSADVAVVVRDALRAGRAVTVSWTIAVATGRTEVRATLYSVSG